VTAEAGCRLIGRRRIIPADVWDRAYLDLVEPANLQIGVRFCRGYDEL
jgi:hypothetical protein